MARKFDIAAKRGYCMPHKKKGGGRKLIGKVDEAYPASWPVLSILCKGCSHRTKFVHFMLFYVFLHWSPCIRNSF